MRRLLADESGSAALEFLAAGVLLLVPLIYLGLALSALQGASLAVEGAAREAARVYVASGTDAEAVADSQRAVTVALADHGIARRAGDLTLGCDAGGPACLTAGTRVTATVSTVVDLPLVPRVFGLDRVARVPVRASATAPIFRLGGAP